MKIMLQFILLSLLLVSCNNKATYINPKTNNGMGKINNTEEVAKPISIHSFKVNALDGSEIDFSKFKGKKILIVNTASQCGYTSQYEGLEKLYQQYKSKLVIVGFPANNFGGQEPGSNEEIAGFCKKNYGVSFPMAAKISVKGDDAAPIYKWLCNKTQNGVLDAVVKWNFNKFLLNENGEIIAKFDSGVEPSSEKITSVL
jgi:glutathione peroxidase